jgi:two-component system sensor histidine kinase UhpB
MVAQRVLFARRYRAALLDYLLSSDEAGLVRAYELGRVAMLEGLGLLEVLRIHQGATQTIVSSTRDIEVTLKTLGSAGEFLMETLSPFEMAYRGYVASLQGIELPPPPAPPRRRDRQKR